MAQREASHLSDADFSSLVNFELLCNVCVSVCSHVCKEHMYGSVCVEARGQFWILFLRSYSPCSPSSPNRVSHWDLGFIDLARLAGQGTPRILSFCLPELRKKVCVTMFAFYVRGRDRT